MRFSKHTLYGYDDHEIEATSMHDLIQRGLNDGKQFTLSGLYDLPETIGILNEWYETSCPKLQVREIRNRQSPTPAEVDPLYNEPLSGSTEIDRSFTIPVMVKETSPRKKHGKEGTETEQVIELFVGTGILAINDYWPAMGDLFRWRGQWLQVNAVTVESTDYHGHTAIPLHVKMAVDWYRFDGDNTKIGDKGELGAAIEAAPQVDVPAGPVGAPDDGKAKNSYLHLDEAPICTGPPCS